MKTRKSIVLISSLLLLCAFAFTACHKDNNDKNNTGQMFTISGNATGTQMVPSVSGSGSAAIAGTYDAGTGQLNYTTTWNGLTGAPTSGGFYSGASGTNGTIVGSAWALGSGLTGTGTFTGTTTLTADQAAQLTSGNWYYTLGTATNASGEVRGQITATPQ